MPGKYVEALQTVIARFKIGERKREERERERE